MNLFKKVFGPVSIHFLFWLLLPAGSLAQWVQNAPFPGGGRFASMGFTLGGEAYVVGGLRLQGGAYLGFNDLYRYDEANDSWTMLDPYPAGNIYGGVAFVIDNVAYVGLGGDQNGMLSNKLYAFDPVSEQWSIRANFPGTRRVYPFSFTADQKGYLGTGVRFVGGNPDHLQDVWMYDPGADTWTAVADYPGGGRVGCASFSLADRGQVGLGDDGNSFHSDFHEYDPLLDTWTPKANVSTQNKSFASCISVNGQGFMLGGESAGLTFTNSMQRYDQATDSWSAAYNFTGTARRYGIFYLIDQTFYYGLGQTGPSDSNVTDDLWELLSDVSIQAPGRAQSPEFLVFPSLVSVGATVTLTSRVPGEFQVYDMLGALIWSRSLSSGETKETLPAAVHGMYSFRFVGTGSQAVTSGRLLVQ